MNQISEEVFTVLEKEIGHHKTALSGFKGYPSNAAREYILAMQLESTY